MLNRIHRSIITDNMKWDAYPPAQKWVNTILLAIIVLFLLTSTNPWFALTGLALSCYIILARIWYWTVLILWKVFPPPEEKEEEEKEE